MTKTRKYLINVFYGFLAWLIPFVASFFFYSRDGKLNIDIFLFKSIMIIVGSTSAGFLLISYFKKINENYFKEGIILGVVWFILNILLDLLVLVPMSKMPVADYFTHIGFGYIVIFVMCITVGTALANKK